MDKAEHLRISVDTLQEAVAACRAKSDDGAHIGIRLSDFGFEVFGSRVVDGCIATAKRTLTFADVARCAVNALLETVNAVADELSAARVIEAA